MPSLESYIASRAASDYALAVLTLIVLVCCILLVRVWRASLVRSVAKELAWLLIPLLNLYLLSPAGVASLFAAGVFASIQLPAYRIDWERRQVMDLRGIYPSISPKLLLALIFLLALFIRAPQLYESLWYDESFTATVAQLPLEQLPAAIANDVHPPLYYLVKWFWVQANDPVLIRNSPALFRVPDLVFGLFTLYLLYRLTFRLTQQRSMALTAALLCTLMPAAIYYSVEARSYALLTVLVLGALLSLMEERRFRFVLLLAALPLTHNLGWAYFGILVLIALYRWRWTIAPFLVGIFLVETPALLLALKQSHAVTDGYWLQFNLAQPLWTLSFNLQTIDPDSILTLLLPYLAITFLSFWVARHWLLGSANGHALLALLVSVPVGVIVLSVVWKPIYLHRAFLPLSLLLLVPLAIALNSSTRAYFRPVTACVVLLALLGFNASRSAVRPDYRDMLNQCGEAQVVYATSIQAAFLARGNSSRRVVLWRGAVDNGQTMTVDQMPSFGFEVGDPPRGLVCLLFEESPRTSERERTFIALATAEAELHALLLPQPYKRIHIYQVYQ